MITIIMVNKVRNLQTLFLLILTKKKDEGRGKMQLLESFVTQSFALLAHHEALLLNMAKESSGISLSNVKALPQEIKGQLSYVEG